MGIQIYFLRHGQTSHSRDNLFCGSGTDAMLTAEGERMAQAFAERYRSAPWKGIFVSPQTRAQRTAAPIAKALGCAVETREGLREIGYGKWEGETVETVTEKYPADYKQWLADPAICAPTGGESARAIAARVGEVLDEVRSKFDSGNVLLVSHKATIRVALCALLGIDLKTYRYRLSCPVCSLSVIEMTKNGPLLRTLADRSHLPPDLLALPGT